mgnify:CR=1 FL=1
MTMVNIAFSGGVESTYLLQLALERGFNVNVVMINANNHLDTRIGEIIAMERIIKFYENAIREGKDYLPRRQQRFKGSIRDIIHVPVCPFPASQNEFKSLVTYDVTQQFAIVLGMLMVRRDYVDTVMPSTWIGWIKSDSAETTFNETDFTEDDYGALLKLPKTIGPLSNADNIGVEFRTPLWNMDKRDIYDELVDEVKTLLIPNGSGHVLWKNGTVVHDPYDHKLAEWKAVGIPLQAEYVFDIKDASWIGRYCSGTSLPEDMGLADSAEAREFVRGLTPFFCKGRSVIRPKDVDPIRREITSRVENLIRHAQALPSLTISEEDVQRLIRESA